MNRPIDVILQDLARQRNRVAQLEAARADALARIESLLMELDASSTATRTPPMVSADEVPRTPAEKVSLFRSLFRGRPDVFLRDSSAGRQGNRATLPRAPTSSGRASAVSGRVASVATARTRLSFRSMTA